MPPHYSRKIYRCASFVISLAILNLINHSKIAAAMAVIAQDGIIPGRLLASMTLTEEIAFRKEMRV